MNFSTKSKVCTNVMVKESLSTFLNDNIEDCNISAIDDIVLDYVVGILEELGEGSNPTSDDFDICLFCEMMSAYLPGFESVNDALVCEWVFSLSRCLNELKSKPKSLSASLPASPNMDIAGKSSINQPANYSLPTPIGGRAHSTSSTASEDSVGSCGNASCSSGENPVSFDVDPDLKMLREMFPHVASRELLHCWAVASGNLEEAAQVVLLRQESGDYFTTGIEFSCSRLPNQNNPLNAQQMKDCILERYAYVDQADDSREHKPVTPKFEGKKLVRYRDNKIVSIKGEKYTEIRDEDQDALVKKTTASVKPAKQYRFH